MNSLFDGTFTGSLAAFGDPVLDTLAATEPVRKPRPKKVVWHTCSACGVHSPDVSRQYFAYLCPDCRHVMDDYIARGPR